MSVCFELNQESDNSLAIKIREQVFEKLKDCKTPEELKDTLLTILSENDENLDLEKIQNGEEVSRLLDNFLVCSIETTPDNLDSNQIQLGSLLQNAVDLVCNPPGFSIPYPYPTIDDTGDFTNKLLLALLRLAIKIILSIIKKLLSLIIEICNNGLSAFNSYGSLSLSSIISQSIGDEVSNSFIAEVFDVFGINENGHSTQVITVGQIEECEEPSEPSAIFKDVNKFLDDLSSMTTPVEICSLLNNKARDTTFQVVEELLEFEYPELRKRLNTRSKISGLFKTLGSKTDPSICQLIEDNSEKIIAAPELCFTEDVNSVREALLKQRNLTDQEIKDVLEQERQKTRKNLEQLAELSSIIKTNPNKLLGETPQIFCNGDKPGIMGLDDMPSLKSSINDTMNSTFNTFAYVFKLNSSNFVNNIIETKVTENTDDKVIKKFTDVTSIDNNGTPQIIENGLNPKFMQKVSAGQYTLSDPDGNTDQESLLRYYKDLKVNDKKIVNNDVIDVQTLINNTNYDSFEGGEDSKVFIKNYNYTNKVTPDSYEVTKNINNYLSIDYDKMSISFSIPNKYLNTRSTENVSNFDTLPSTQTITIFPITGSST